jgi:cholesterol transport system auxiliary component
MIKAAVLSLILTGCSLGALTAGPAQTPLRYFSPEGQEVETTSAASSAGAPEVRVGHVTSSASLRTRIVHRDSAYELGMYETLRWTDNPEVYVRRNLDHALFDRGAARQAESDSAPTLDVEVVAFEEVRSRSKRSGRVELRYTLSDDTHIIDSGTAAAERPAEDSSMAAIVAAIGQAMSQATSSLTARVTSRLR